MILPAALSFCLLGAAPPDQGKWRALPYLQGYRPAVNRPLVVEHDPAAVAPGLNLVLSGHAAEAVLLDRKGRTLHRWRHPLRRLWPGAGSEKLEYWRRAWLFPNGDLLAIYEGLGIVKLDARSNVIWARRGGFHHDLQVMEDGRIWVLDRQGRGRVLEDFVTVLDPRGRIERRISILKALGRSAPSGTGDVLHTNTLEVLDGGNVLLSILQLDALAILDPDKEEIVWMKKGSWRRQHQPTWLDDGGILLFDNLGGRAIEIDPETGGVRWQFGGLSSKTLGSVQRLPNGNTLITESENGRALEVTRDGRVVWEFNNPHRVGKLGAVLFEVVRLPESFPFKG